MASWLGHSVDEVASAWGPPSEHFGHVVGWRWAGDRTTHYAIYAGSAEATTSTPVCHEWFDVRDDGVIVGWHWQGNC